MTDKCNCAPVADISPLPKGDEQQRIQKRSHYELNVVGFALVWFVFEVFEIKLNWLGPLLRAALIMAIGGAVGEGIAWLFSKKASLDPSKPRLPKDPAQTNHDQPLELCNSEIEQRGGSKDTKNGLIVLDQKEGVYAVADEHITTLQVPAVPPTSNAEWHVIYRGAEYGPMPLADLIEKAAAGNVEADDLVKQTGGLWTKARDFAYLQQQFLVKHSLKGAESNAVEEAKDSEGPLFSKKELVIYGCAFLGSVVFFLWGINSSALPPVQETKTAVDYSTDLRTARIPDPPPYFPPAFDPPPEIVTPPKKVFVDATNLYIKPEITIKGQSNLAGYQYGSVHNGTGKTIERMKLSIKTQKWERVYEISCFTTDNTTNTFVVQIGEESLGVWGCRLLGVVFKED